MQELKDCDLFAVHGGGVRLATVVAVTTLACMAIGSAVGANALEPALDYFNPKPVTLIGMATNYAIAYKYGHLGLDSKADIIGAAGGAIAGAVLGPTLVALFI